MDAQSLSIYGKHTVDKSIIRQVFYWYVYAYHRQTIFHLGEVRSLRWDIYRSENNESNLIKNISESLYTLYDRYFPNEKITVEVNTRTENDARIYISIDISAKLKDEEFRLSDLVVADEKKIYDKNPIYDTYYKYLKT